MLFQSASLGLFHSSSFHYDIDNLSFEKVKFTNLYYEGCKQTKKTTTDVTSCTNYKGAITKLVKKDTGDSTLDTGEGIT